MYKQALQTMTPDGISNRQAEQFEAMAEELREKNGFYKDKWKEIPSGVHSLSAFPLTTKGELLANQKASGPFGTNLTYPEADYTRIHQTSGTTGTPLRVLDTEESWNWWGECWRYILDAAGIGPADRVMVAFSFGPFIGFWAAQHALAPHGSLLIPGGGMTSPQRLAAMRDLGATALICTPSYALHLAEVAAAEGMDPAKDLNLRVTLHAGEPGAGIPATRKRIETLWGAQTFDHPGASEIGAFGFSCSAQRGVHINEAEFIAEIIHPETQKPVPPGERGELVLTNLGRRGFPVVRYRSGDMVSAAPRSTCTCGRTFMLLEGGILGRSDDMVTIRGVNVFPSAFLELFNTIKDISEHRITAYTQKEMAELHIEFETPHTKDRKEEVAAQIREKLGIRVSLKQSPPGTLPRFDLKAKRFFDRRNETWQP